ncbi:MAG TPA: nucleoside-triphosphatase [Phycisphaerae bacterium]|nr:nucleoside-triphosphatase [Phycisphaerae bacterium]
MSNGADKAKTAVTNILLTGRPGIGKTTVITRLADLLSNKATAGFYTGEIREGGQRQGFGATTFSGGSGVLAHVGLQSRRRVGRYGVDVAAFEQLVLPELGRGCDVMLIDEIGKMECFSTRFVNAVRGLLDGPTPIVATVGVSGGGFIAEVKARFDAEVWQVTRESRDGLPQRLAERVAATLRQ